MIYKQYSPEIQSYIFLVSNEHTKCILRSNNLHINWSSFRKEFLSNSHVEIITMLFYTSTHLAAICCSTNYLLSLVELSIRTRKRTVLTWIFPYGAATRMRNTGCSQHTICTCRCFFHRICVFVNRYNTIILLKINTKSSKLKRNKKSLI